MRYGRIPNAENPLGYDLILAQNFNAAVHGETILCADSNCNAKMFFRRNTVTHGGSQPRQKHFATFRSSTHVKGCLAVMRDQASKRSMGLLDAVYNPRAFIVLNLNFNTGHSDFGKLGRQVIEHQPTPYNLLLDKHRHASVSIKNLTELFKLAARVEGVNSSAIKRITLGHCQNIISLGAAMINSTEKVKNLYKTLYAQKALGNNRSHMPTIFDFAPLAKYKQNDEAFLYGQGVLVQGKKRQNYTIQHVLDFGGHTYLKGIFQEKGRGKIMAIPDVNYDEAQAMSAYVKTRGALSRPPKYRLYWRVLSEKQFHNVDDSAGIQTQLFTPGYPLAAGL
jgi:acyl-CoA-binding protein